MRSDWKEKRLGDVATIVAGQSPPSATYNSEGVGLPFFQGKADFGEFYPVTRLWCSEPSKEAEANDVLISVRAPVGPTNLAPVRCCIGRGLSAIRTESKLDHMFLLYYLRSIESRIAASGRGSTFGSITQNDLKELPIPLSPLPEQRRIAAILDKADAIRCKRREAIRLLDDFLRSVFLDMFGDPVTNPKGWPIRTLAEFYINAKDGTKCGPFGSALKKGELVESGVAVWNMDNISVMGEMTLPFRMWITPEKYQELASYSVIDGDIVISRAGTVGKMCVVHMNGQPGIISTNLIRLRLGPELLPIYFVSLMLYCSTRIGRLRTGSDGAFTHMNTSILDSLQFPYPPPAVQKRFSDLQSMFVHKKLRLIKHSEEAESLFASMQSRAFKEEL